MTAIVTDLVRQRVPSLFAGADLRHDEAHVTEVEGLGVRVAEDLQLVLEEPLEILLRDLVRQHRHLPRPAATVSLRGDRPAAAVRPRRLPTCIGAKGCSARPVSTKLAMAIPKTAGSVPSTGSTRSRKLSTAPNSLAPRS
jgi:hypothetical protein